MASSPSDRETEAYFRSVMAGELHVEETVGVMMNPKVINNRCGPL